ncbi:MAG: rRNA maturation RNase YbeY [Flavobacteriaceae bacterium]|nr:MAG: rRNA maturation RNase YbeY [Flavobacteriaceae bacterium]
MIIFNYINDFLLDNEEVIFDWILSVARNDGFEVEYVNYIFCDDDYLHKLNIQYLKHDTLTDIISFDNTEGRIISGDIFISTERVAENARTYRISFEEELQRVLIHGMLHFMRYNDKEDKDIQAMRGKENEALKSLPTDNQ